MNPELSQEQGNEMVALQQWFNSELAELKKRELKILRDYDKKKSELLKNKLNLARKSD